MAPTYGTIQRLLSVLVVTSLGVGEMESDFDIVRQRETMV